MAISTQYSYFEIFYNPDIPLRERVAWAAVSPIAIPVAALGLLQGCDSSKASSLPSTQTTVSSNPIDEYTNSCDGVAKHMSAVAACGQYQHQTDAADYSSSVSLYVPQDNTQQDVDHLLSSGQCMVKCAWAAPAQPKYNKAGGLCEYILRLSQSLVYSNGSPYIYKSTITTDQSQAYDYFDYCLGDGYLP